MRRLLFPLMLIVLAAALGPKSAAAAIVGDVQVAFSADRTLVIDDRTYTGRVFAIPGRQRHEQTLGGVRQIVILHAGRAQGWLVLPDLNTYVAFTFPRAAAELSDPELRRNPMGRETVNGIPTTRYRIQHHAKDGTVASGYLWISAAGVIMRADGTIVEGHGGKPVLIHMELSNLRQEPQDPALFELPHGLARLPSGALEPLMRGAN